MITIGNEKVNIEFSDINETHPIANILTTFEIIVNYLLEPNPLHVSNYIAEELYDKISCLYPSEIIDTKDGTIISSKIFHTLESILYEFGINTFKIDITESDKEIETIDSEDIKILYLVDITVNNKRGTYSRLSFINPAEKIVKLSKHSLIDSGLDIYNMPGATIKFNSLYLISIATIN